MSLATSHAVWACYSLDIIDAACCRRLVDRSCIIRVQKRWIV
nr:MAG TPA: hypothetical protein [Caudoviricetes sp.]